MCRISLPAKKLGNILRKIRTAIAAFIAHLSPQRTPHKISAADISAAAMDHKHNADDVTSGAFPFLAAAPVP